MGRFRPWTLKPCLAIDAAQTSRPGGLQPACPCAPLALQGSICAPPSSAGAACTLSGMSRSLEDRAAIWAHPVPGPRLPAALQTVVLSLTVVWDLIAAVAVGCILSSLQFTRRMAEIEIESLQITSSSDLDGGLPSREESGLREEELQLMKRFSGAPMGWGSHPVSAAQLGRAACIEPKHLVAVEL